MNIYLVGGAVRDQLLGLAVKDRDYVVVGATPQQMQALGYRPVGKDFPVFLHPATRAEYALARTERKTAPGYRGFVFHAAPDVTLAQDLVRRDLTINAIAQAEDGTLLDPFGGVRDIEQRIFRHVSSAFGEDPVRILRVARFAARFVDFTVAPDTMTLMRRMVAEGEVDALVPERVWQELARGLMEAAPSRMLDVLRACGALARILPELDGVWRAAFAPQAARRMAHAVDDVAAHGADLALRFARLMHDPAGSAGADQALACQQLIAQACQRLRVPNECRDLAIMSTREQRHIVSLAGADPDAAVTLFERCDAFRKPQRFGQLLQACVRAEDQQGAAMVDPTHWWQAALAAARGVDAGSIAHRLQQSPQQIPAAIHAARTAAVALLAGKMSDHAAGSDS